MAGCRMETVPALSGTGRCRHRQTRHRCARKHQPPRHLAWQHDSASLLLWSRSCNMSQADGGTHSLFGPHRESASAPCRSTWVWSRALTLSGFVGSARCPCGRARAATGLAGTSTQILRRKRLAIRNARAGAANRTRPRRPGSESVACASVDLVGTTRGSTAGISRDSKTLAARPRQLGRAGKCVRARREEGRCAAPARHCSAVLAAKFIGSATAHLPRFGAITTGGAVGHDNAVIPKSEAFFDLDHGWKTGEGTVLRGLEFSYGQHWYWYRTARILALNGVAIIYLPREWSFSLAATGGRSAFSGTGVEWRPSGSMRLGFPVATWRITQLSGNIFYGAGTENFALSDQIGAFASQTYGGGLRFRFSERQDITCVSSYQRRTQNRTDAYLGFSYGIHF